MQTNKQTDFANRGDLINRCDAIDAALTFIVEYCGAAFDEDMQKMLCEKLDELPSAQPEIIRCKDCKKNPHWEWVGCPMTGKNTRKPDDFCSYAERRTDDER